MTGAPKVRISVIVPTRDRAELLQRTLARLAPGVQTLAPDAYEVVVSDDAQPSTAGAFGGATFPWVRVVQGPGRGPAANRNAGARAARHPWLAFTDDDTEPSPGWLAALANAITPGTDVYEGRTTCDGGFGSPLCHAPVNETGGRLWSCNFMISADAFWRVGGFDETFPHAHMEDTDLRIRLEQAGFRRVFVRDAVVNHPPRRQPPGSRLGALRESEVRFHVKHHGRPEPRARFVARVARYRLGVIRDTPKGPDTVVALWSLLCELSHVLRNVGRWERTAMRMAEADAREPSARR